MPVHARSVLAAMMAVTTTLSAQVTITGDAALNSQYQARGLTTTNHPVIQGELRVATPVRRGVVTGGVWASMEPTRYNNADHHISENNGARAGIAEWNLWGEASIPVGRLTFTPGVLGYVFPNTEGTTSESNTLELYFSVGLDAPLAPTVTAWHDVEAVRGVYTEFSVSQTLGRLDLGATSGWNATQSFDDGGRLGYYQRRGFTHFEVSAGTTWEVGGVSVAPAAHVVWGSDPTTHVTAPTAERGTKLWFGTTISWSHTVGRRSGNNGGGAAGAAGGPQQVAAK